MTTQRAKTLLSRLDRLIGQHRIVHRVRKILCHWLACPTYDQQAGFIVDAAIADRDQLAEEVARLRAALGERPTRKSGQ